MKPEPVNKHVVCSLCGLDWGNHTKVTEIRGEKIKEPTAEVCIELLKVELRKPQKNPWVVQSSSSFPYWPQRPTQ